MEINVDAGEGKKNRLEMEQNSSVCLSNVNISLNLCNCTQISVDGINFHEKKKKFSSLQSDLIHQLRMKLKKTFRDIIPQGYHIQQIQVTLMLIASVIGDCEVLVELPTM